MKAFITLMFWLLFTTLFAQNAKIDSLKKVIATTKVDTVKGRSLCRLCDELSKEYKNKEALLSGNEGLGIVLKKNDRWGKGICSTILGKTYAEVEDYSTALAYFQSGLKIFEQYKDEKRMLLILNAIGVLYNDKNEPKFALQFLNQSLRLAQKIGNEEYISMIYANMGISFNKQGKQQLALDFYNKAIQLLIKNENYATMINLYTNIGDLYFELGNYTKALEYNFKSLDIIDKYKGNLSNRSSTLLSIGNIYTYQGEFDKALSYFNESLLINQKLGIQSDIANSFVNIGIIYNHKMQYEQAINYLLKALSIFEMMNDKDGIASVLGNIATVYGTQKKYTIALEQFQKALKIFQNIDNPKGITESLINIGYCYIDLRNPILAKTYALQGLERAIKIRNLEMTKSASEIIFQSDTSLQNWKSAFEHHKLYKQYSDSLHNEDKAKEFGRIESRYQFEKEAEEQKRKEAEAKRLAQIETERRNNLQYLSIFGGLMVLFGLLAFIGRFSIPVRVLDISLFATLLILFEFLLILFDPILDRYTGGIPIQKLVFNSVIALGFAPLHGFLEKKLRGRFVKASPN